MVASDHALALADVDVDDHPQDLDAQFAHSRAERQALETRLGFLLDLHAS